MFLYNKFSDYLKKRYGCKVYKLPLNIPVTCPNRDGNIGNSGCIFCGEEGAGFESLSCFIPIQNQLKKNMQYIKEKYNTDKFIAYFQNYTNTYLPYRKFRKYILDACIENIVAIYISTRPDCIDNKYLELLNKIKIEKKVDVVIELGLQSVNYKTLHFLKRGHGLAEFIDAVLRIKKYELESCAHYIVDLPMDDKEDIVEGAKIISALGIEQVKCHSLYILKDTQLGKLYLQGRFKPLKMEEYIERMILFLEHLSPKVVVQRLLGRAPKERTLFCNWNTSWWKIQERIEKKMKKENRFQGKYPFPMTKIRA